MDAHLDAIAALIREFSDSEYQERVWLRAEGTEVSSYGEAVCELFDDYRFDEIVDGRWREAGVPEAVLPRLRAFRDALAEFNRRIGAQPSPEAILADPEWPSVVRLAERVVAALGETGWSGSS